MEPMPIAIFRYGDSCTVQYAVTEPERKALVHGEGVPLVLVGGPLVHVGEALRLARLSGERGRGNGSSREKLRAP